MLRFDKNSFIYCTNIEKRTYFFILSLLILPFSSNLFNFTYYFSYFMGFFFSILPIFWYVRCLILGIIPSLVLIFFKNLPSFRIGAYRLVLIKDNACTFEKKIPNSRWTRPMLVHCPCLHALPRWFLEFSLFNSKNN